MNLDTALQINAAAMSAARTRINVASSNLANAETTRTEEGGPFRRRMVIQKAEILKDEAGYPIGRHEGMSIREPIAAGIAFDNSPPRLVLIRVTRMQTRMVTFRCPTFRWSKKWWI